MQRLVIKDVIFFIESYRAGAILGPVNSTRLEYLMKTRFSQDIIPLSDLKINPGKIANQAKDSHRPILLTSRGRGIAVIQGLEEFENHEEERAFVKAIAQGLLEIKEGKVRTLTDAKNKLGINT